MSVTQNILSRQLELTCARRQPLSVFASCECSLSLDHDEGEGRSGGNVPGETRRRRQKFCKGYPNSYVKRLNENFHGVPNMVKDLRAAVKSGNLKTVTKVLVWVSREVMGAQTFPLQGSTLAYADPDSSAGVKRLAREAFVLLGGTELLVQLFCKPLSPTDVHCLSSHEISERAMMWSMALLALRELSCMEPALASRLASKDFIHSLFSLMSIPCVFDNAVALVEDVLATQPTTFSLDSVPRIAELLQSLDSRQLAHFCRVLALLVLDSKDRQFMESSTVLHSMDLLQMRRNRVYSAGSVVDRNHAVILAVPGLLSRLAKLLQLVSFGPSLTDASDSQYLLHTILEHEGGDAGGSWESINELLKCAKEGPDADEESELEGNKPSSSEIRSGGGPMGLLRWFRNAGAASQPARSNSMPSSLDQPEEHSREEGGGGSSIIASSDQLRNGGGLVVQHGVDMAASPLFVDVSSGDGSGMEVTPDTDVNVTTRLFNFARSLQSDSKPRPRSLCFSNSISRMEARLRLRYRALIIFAHCAEIIFVLSTLLSGRRKPDVQQLLADMGIVESLTDLFPKLSWGCPTSSPNPLKGIHGPDCECSPESSFRVQYLRLVHKFCDGDCTPAPNHNSLMLSKEEQEAEEAIYGNDIDRKHAKNGGVGNNNASPFQTRQKGLLSMIINVYMSEPTQSMYRFWLASCVEAFLRGASAKEQSFVMRSGLLQHLTAEITSHPVSGQKELENVADNGHFEKTCQGGSSHSGGTGSLQTGFDVLAELSKGNLDVLQQLDDSLDANGLSSLFQVLRSNLVDSNVFLRSLVITLELFNQSWNKEVDDEDTMNEELGLVEEKVSKSSFQHYSSVEEVGYLSCVWCNVQTECGDFDVRSPTHSNPEPGTVVSGHGLGGLGYSLENGVPQMQMELCDETATAPSKPDAIMTNVGARGDGGLITTTPKRALPSCKLRKGKRCERLLRFLKEDSQQLLVDLMGTVSLHKLNYENLCTINTVILMIIQMRRSGGVGAIAAMIENIRASSRGNCILKGFCALLFFWREYYGKRGRDRINLEFSSHVPFCEWLAVVEMLCADNGQPGSLVLEALKLPQSPYARRPFI